MQKMNDAIKTFLENLPEHKRAEILLQFRQSFREHADKCVSGFNEKSYKVLRHGAHDLKTLSRLISEMPMADLCEKIEISALNENDDVFSFKNEFLTLSTQVQKNLDDFAL